MDRSSQVLHMKKRRKSSADKENNLDINSLRNDKKYENIIHQYDLSHEKYATLVLLLHPKGLKFVYHVLFLLDNKMILVKQSSGKEGSPATLGANVSAIVSHFNDNFLVINTGKSSLVLVSPMKCQIISYLARKDVFIQFRNKTRVTLVAGKDIRAVYDMVSIKAESGVITNFYPVERT